jgi:predicted nuclease of predicted toxin-antitoxin system
LKVLLDQNAPRPLARFLAHHQVIRSAELGWSSLKNGELLQAAEQDGFDVMVTPDRNLAYQQNLRERLLAIVVLPSGRWPEIEPHVPAVAVAVDRAKPSSYVEIPASDPEMPQVR